MLRFSARVWCGCGLGLGPPWAKLRVRGAAGDRECKQGGAWGACATGAEITGTISQNVRRQGWRCTSPTAGLPFLGLALGCFTQVLQCPPTKGRSCSFAFSCPSPTPWLLLFQPTQSKPSRGGTSPLPIAPGANCLVILLSANVAGAEL